MVGWGEGEGVKNFDGGNENREGVAARYVKDLRTAYITV